ncbi:DUF6660 family protein [Tenacibaculum sp. IB213877]|uniref:DUF6660 family protein n=1 Tax=Tenacibaculum sp. IB213877 TaxID=3097351 RepID=UPI002A5AFAEC|nr:DUF6660 family protein [Tenacibaculum sp. IB213877]MDY0779366.1 DUF6660 family protein [Tenacibaculum sp. IB213877]
MKLLTFILSIYIFGLNLMPCEDNGMTQKDIQTEISQKLNNDHQHQDSDLCSPFCQCHCCHVHITQFKIVDYSISTSVISTHIFLNFEGIEKNFNTTLLQPPQI